MARRYAWKVMSLIQQGCKPQKAREIVDEELAVYRAQRHEGGSTLLMYHIASTRVARRQQDTDESVIKSVQRQEEEQLQEAVKQRRQDHADDSTGYRRITVKVAGLDVTL